MKLACLNLCIVHGIRGRGAASDAIIGSVPFVIAMFAMIALLTVFPGIALVLPDAAFPE